LATDLITLTNGQHVINSQLLYATAQIAPYLIIKLGVTQIDLVTADHAGLFTSYSYTNNMGHVSTRTRITLPVVETVQQTIPYDGQWTIILYNNREDQRQSLTKALKPRADL
jgi:ABC-type thiamine transport system substrate-binding protein